MHIGVDEGQAKFLQDFDGMSAPGAIKLGWRYLVEFLRDGRTPIRAISDEAVRQYLPFLYGPGAIIELGAPSDYYRCFAPAEQNYQITDYSDRAAFKVNMTDMPFDNETVDAFVSVFSLEHVQNYQRALAEVRRTLKKRGRFLLIMPFLYYYHAAPDDYVRLTRSALLAELRGYRFLAVESLGSRALFVAEMYHEKAEMGHSSSWLRRTVFRCMASIFVASYVWRAANEEIYASAILVLCEKA
jgi:SAM-dependent methyltransferase